MRFSKIRYHRGKVRLDWTTPNGEDKEHHWLESEDAPNRDFEKALEAFRADILSVLNLPKGYGEDLEVHTVSVDRDENGRFGVVISATKKVPAGSFALSTPRLQEPAEDSKGGAKVLNDQQLERLQVLQAAAEAYAKGDRQQGELFEGPKAAA